MHSDESHTFHGRDVYAYNGARLASGQLDFSDIGPKISNWPIIERLVETIGSFPNVVRCDLMGQISHMQCGSDRFGNTIHRTDRTIC